MRKRQILLLAALLVVLFIVISACSNSSTTPKLDIETEEVDDLSQSNESLATSTSNTENEQVDDQPEQTDHQASEEPIIEVKPKDQEANITNTGTKIEGRKTEFLNKLDHIQRELDAMPEKEDADKGVTNAMKSYYGYAYEVYDKELNEIYALLKKELSHDTMTVLKAEQLKWIERKEMKAEEERQKYHGGTFEHVAMYISLYEATRDRCYELVNEYMTD